MHYYYANKVARSDGVNEVHKSDCKLLPEISKREYLGYYSDYQDAILKAQTKFELVEGCKNCILD